MFGTLAFAIVMRELETMLTPFDKSVVLSVILFTLVAPALV